MACDNSVVMATDRDTTSMKGHSPTDLAENGTGSFRFDARDYLLALVALPDFRMEHSTVRLEIEPGTPLPGHVAYGWNHVPPTAHKTNDERDLAGTTRNKIAGVLPPTMKCLAEMLCQLQPDQLPDFCARIEITGTRPIRRQGEANELLGLARLRLRGKGETNDTQRKQLRRQLERINPVVCRPPIDHLGPPLKPGDVVAVSASQLHLYGRVVCLPSTANHTVVGSLSPQGLELAAVPSPRDILERWKRSVDPDPPFRLYSLDG